MMLQILAVLAVLIGEYRCQIKNNDQCPTLNNYASSNNDYQQKKMFPENSQVIDDSYNFIVVGAGSAGSVIANRLSEVPHWKVLLIEAGRPPSTITEIPALATLLSFSSDHNWKYFMEKDERFGLGLENQLMAWPCGKGLGGSSIIDYMIHSRGNHLDFDNWEKMGNSGWSYEKVLPYFLKSEDFLVSNGDEGYHNRGGYLGIEDVPHKTESAHVFVKAAQEIGLKYVDYNGKTQNGVSFVHGTLRDGRRCSTEKAFLRPVRNRSNLTILTEARVTKVLINPETKMAYGVEYYHQDKFYRVKAENEIVLSAGAFHSPQLLMLSGVGPKKHLESFGIEVLKDLPVGRKLYDHISFLGLIFTLNQTITAEVLNNFSPEAYIDLIKNNRGPLTMLGGTIEALAYINTNISEEISDYPDIELVFTSGSLHSDGGLSYKTSLRISDEIYNTVWKPIENQPGWQVLPILKHPISHGFLELRSNNPFDSPKLHGNYFSDPLNRDVETLVAAIRVIQKISETTPFQKYGSKQVETPIPGCELHENDSFEYWECALRHLTVTGHHQVATCKMGSRDDPEAVVSNELKVYGVEKLRVADTSVMPTTTTGHTNAAAVMVGEKVADMIKQYWKYHTK